MMDKLLPCPFCGGEGCIQEHVFVGYTSTFGVVCLDCCAGTRQFFNTKDEAIAAWNRRSDAVPVVRGEWTYTIKKGSCMDYHVTAKCSECGWDWFSKEGVGNYSAVFSAFITNGDSRPEEVKRFLLENARANNNLNYCPNCGAKMEDKP